jgi:hypothetical protein
MATIRNRVVAISFLDLGIDMPSHIKPKPPEPLA